MISFWLVCTFVVIFLYLPCTNTTLLFKCPTFDNQSGNLTNVSKSNSMYVTVPASLMSNFEPVNFRLESDSLYFCDMSYEVIKINLIGSDFMNINLSTPLQAVHTVRSYTEEDESSLGSTAASIHYGPLSKSRNNSHFDGFMYSVENITVIFDTSAYETEKQEQACYRKLNRNGVHFTPSGVLFYGGEYYRPGEYCVLLVDEIAQEMTIRKCNINCNNEHTPCIPLCCHLHEYMDLSVPCCQATVRSKPIFQPVIYDETNRRFSLEEIMEPSGISKAAFTNTNKVVNDSVFRPHYVTFKHQNTCPDGMEPLHLFFNESGESNLNTRIHIKSNGKAAYIGADKQWHFLDNYCVAGIVNVEGFTDAVQAMTTILHYCLDEEVHGVMWPNYLLVGAFSFSSVFLLLTLVVYILLWDKQNIHGWTITSFVLSEFLLFTFLAVSYTLSLFSNADDTSNTSYCIGSGILAHFFFLSTFSWLTIINLDLWWTFRSLTPLSERSKGRKRFCLYMIFAWGLPITVVSVGVILQSMYKDNMSGVIVPDYGIRECFLAKHAKGVYLYYIIGVLLFANCILITLTFFTIYKFKKSTRVASSSSSKSKEQSFRLFLKLVMVMGVTWIFEFVIWWDTNGEEFSWIYIAIDVMNILQAVSTFLIFVCKRKIINQLEQKHPSLKAITGPLLKAMGARPSILLSSTSTKPTRSTNADSSSISKRSRTRSQKQQTIADSRL